MKIIIMETPNFVFHAAGKDEAQARGALRAGIREHARQTGADIEFMLGCVDEANIIDINAGECLRDYGILREKMTP